MNIIITGGGTAGHVNPGIAIAKYFLKRHKDAKILFVGTENGIEKTLATNEGFDYEFVDIKGLKRSLTPKNIALNVKTGTKAITSLVKANKILKSFKPDVIIGLGGYVSFPMCYAGSLKKIPVLLLEVNIFPGVTTKVLSKKAKKILLSFEDTKKYLDKNVLDKALVTGAPIKEEFLVSNKNNAKQKLSIVNKPLVLSFWGSVGALHMNENMQEFINLKDDSFYHIHAVGKNNYDDFIKKVDTKKSDIRPYIYDMETVMSAADIVICRAGAATLSEIAALKKPAIIVPSPYVAENHQEKNAILLQKAGAIKMILEKDASGKVLLEECIKLLSDKEKLDKMSNIIATFQNTKSNDLIYKEILRILM